MSRKPRKIVLLNELLRKIFSFEKLRESAVNFLLLGVVPGFRTAAEVIDRRGHLKNGERYY